MSKLNVFLLLVMLVNISRSQISTDTDPLTTTNSPSDELNWDAAAAAAAVAVAENFNEENSTFTDDEETFSSGAPPAELETTTTLATENESANTDEEMANNEIRTTESVIETQTETTENLFDNENTTPPALIDENATNSDIIETTSDINAEIDKRTESTVESKTTSVPSSVLTCITPGVQAHQTDCQQYYDCTPAEALDGNLHLTAKSCPEKQAFNVELKRCSRDISSCSLDVECVSKGSMADPTGNSSYYLCDPRIDGLGFRIFRVYCASYEIYYPLAGRCLLDPNNLFGFIWDPVKDIYIVRAEMKLLKKQDKLKLKQELDLKKKLEKEAKKKAKEEEKMNKLKSKQEAASFVCVAEGNFASQVASNFYISCINKKGVLKASPMKCGAGVNFNPKSAACEINSTSFNSGISDNADSESDDEDDN